MNDLKLPVISIGIIAYNESKYLPGLLADLTLQTYPKEQIEVILVDSMSDDDTKHIMRSFQADNEKAFHSVTVLDNPLRTQPAGWNVVLGNYTSDIIVRVDAHAALAPDFIEKTVACLNSGEYVCGGVRNNITDKESVWSRTLLKAEESMFGSGIAGYKRQKKDRAYVETVPLAAYRREVTDKVGSFNEALIRTEDNDYNYRVRKAGYRICFDSSIRSDYVIRGSLRGMIRQKHSNGYWIGRTLLISPGCISWYHLVPGLFAAGIISTSAAAVKGFTKPTKTLWGSYAAANLLMSISSKPERPTDSLLPGIFLLLHTAYGAGTIRGIVSGASDKIRRKKEPSL